MAREDAVAAYVELWNLEYPESPETSETVAANLRHLPEGNFEVYKAALDGEGPVGCILIRAEESEVPVRRLNSDLVVRAERASEATDGTIACLSELHSGMNLEAISVWCNDRMPERTERLEAAGLKVIQTVPVSILDLQACDVSHLESKVARVREMYRLASAEELDEEGFDWIPGLWEAACEMIQDLPNPYPQPQPPLEHFRTRVREEKTLYQLDTMILALEGERVVGYSRVSRSTAKPDLALTGLSGVVRTHRRQGIVTALKVEGFERMRRKGIRWLETDNDETNPMYALNMQFGFVPMWKWLRWEMR